MRINLTDNNIGQSSGLCTFHRAELACLFPFADKPISALCKENEGLLIFPHCIKETDDKIGDQPIFMLQNTENPDAVRITTGNIMGFFGIGDLQIRIKSRFDNGRDDFLLHYMLQKVFSMNLFDLNHSSENEEVFDLMMFMFPYFLKTAMRQGLYREYQHFQHNDANIKGTVDVGRHIRQNNSFVGRISYSTREYSYDNNMTELIRHTIEFMRTKKLGRNVLDIDCETMDNVGIICDNTPRYTSANRSLIIKNNLRPSAHPYYTEYRPLQQLCLQILRMEEVKYGEDENEICGVLFDGAWLWEEYVNTVLRDCGFTHPRNKDKDGCIYLFEGKRDNGRQFFSGRRYPDFYKEGFVLDAKYKRLGVYDKVSKVDRDDIHQVITYMYALKSERGGFVVPLEHKRTEVVSSSIVGYDGTLSIFGIEVSRAKTSYSEFCEDMKRNEAAFVESLELSTPPSFNF